MKRWIDIQSFWALLKPKKYTTVTVVWNRNRWQQDEHAYPQFHTKILATHFVEGEDKLLLFRILDYNAVFTCFETLSTKQFGSILVLFPSAAGPSSTSSAGKDPFNSLSWVLLSTRMFLNCLLAFNQNSTCNSAISYGVLGKFAVSGANKCDPGKVRSWNRVSKGGQASNYPKKDMSLLLWKECLTKRDPRAVLEQTPKLRDRPSRSWEITQNCGPGQTVGPSRREYKIEWASRTWNSIQSAWARRTFSAFKRWKRRLR